MSRFFGNKPLEDDVARARIYGGQPIAPATPYTSTSWDGDAKTVGTYTIDTSTVFGLPAGVKSVNIHLAAKWAAADPGNDLAYAVYSGGASAYAKAHVLSWAANVYDHADAWVPCDASGDIDIVVLGGNATGVFLIISEYRQ